MKTANAKKLISTVIDVFICVLTVVLLMTFNVIRKPNQLQFMSNFSFVYHLSCGLLTVYLFIFYLLFNGVSIGRLITHTRLVNSATNRRMKFSQVIVRSLLQGIIVLHLINLIYQLIYKNQDSLFSFITNTHAIDLFQRKSSNQEF